MIQWTDVPYTITVKGADLSTALSVHVTITQKPDVFIDLSGQRVSLLDTSNNNSVLYIELTQAESGSFIEEAVAKVKVNWLDSNAKRHATKTKALKVEENLLKGVIGVV